MRDTGPRLLELSRRVRSLPRGHMPGLGAAGSAGQTPQLSGPEQRRSHDRLPRPFGMHRCEQAGPRERDGPQPGGIVGTQAFPSFITFLCSYLYSFVSTKYFLIKSGQRAFLKPFSLP